jgi:hypothetical protein
MKLSPLDQLALGLTTETHTIIEDSHTGEQTYIKARRTRLTALDQLVLGTEPPRPTVRAPRLDRTHHCVRYGQFITYVDVRDCPNPDHAFGYAADPANRQPWYPSVEWAVNLTAPAVETVTYEQFAAWLRKPEGV